MKIRLTKILFTSLLLLLAAVPLILFSSEKVNIDASCLKQAVVSSVSSSADDDCGDTEIITKQKEINKRLMEAAGENDLEVIQQLIKQKANVNTQNRYGFTPLIRTDNQEIASVLLNSGAEVNAADNSGTTALMLSESLGLTCLLIENKADLDAKDNAGSSAVIWGVMGMHPEIVELLCKRGADLNAPGMDSMTALGVAQNMKGFSQKKDIDGFIKFFLSKFKYRHGWEKISEISQSCKNIFMDRLKNGMEDINKIIKILTDHGADTEVIEIIDE